jgi:proline iminopeptidase
VGLADFVAFRRTLPPPPPLERLAVTVRGLAFAVYRTPAVHGAPPLFCVNGGLIYDHKLLWPALSPLATRRQLYFFDQRGRGRSQAPPGLRAARLEHDAGDVVALRHALALEGSDVLGHSWGGGIAMLAAAEAPHTVRRLVLLAPAGPTGAWRARLLDDVRARLSGDRRATFDAALAALDHDHSIAAHSAYSAALYPAWFHDPSFTELFASPPRATSETGATVATRLYREGYDWTDRLRGLAVPTLIVHGREDPLPVDQAEALVALLADARLRVLDGCGHMPFWERPRETFAHVEAFLSGGEAPA